MSSFVRLSGAELGALCAAFGGERFGADASIGRLVPVDAAGAGDLAPVLRSRFVREAPAAAARGAVLLVEANLAVEVRGAAPDAAVWAHPCATWAMAKVLSIHGQVPDAPPVLGKDVVLGAHVSLAPGVIIGSRVRIGASCVIGSAGFGWATGPSGETTHVPQLGGVVIEDDVWIGPLSTIDAGTLAPTILRRGVKLDASVHVGHNCDIGEGSLVAAQSGFAGSVKIGRGVLVGGQVGIADHVTVGDRARIAAKSGVIGDIPEGAVVAGYPAVPRWDWLRGAATLRKRARQER